MQVKRVPPAIELGAPRGYAQGPSLDGSRPGAYYINLRDTSQWPKWALPTLTYHESIPGHLWQGSIVIENQSIPMLHRNIGIPAYGEGWGLYAEQLADEAGMYADFPAGRIGCFRRPLPVGADRHGYRNACKGWSREQSIRYFPRMSARSHSATSEVERYVVWPARPALQDRP